MFNQLNLHESYVFYIISSIFNVVLGVGIFLMPNDYLGVTRYIFMVILILFDILVGCFYFSEEGEDEFTSNDVEIVIFVNILLVMFILFHITNSVGFFIGFLAISTLCLVSIIVIITPLHPFYLNYLNYTRLFFQLSFHLNVYKTKEYQEYKAKKNMINNKQLTDKDKLDMLKSIEKEFKSYLIDYLISFNTKYVGVFKKNQNNSEFKQSSKEIRQALENTFNELKKTD